MTDTAEERIFSDELDEEALKEYYAELLNSDVKLTFNGINGQTGEYAVAPMTGAELAEVIKGEKPPENLGELKQKRAPGAFPIKPPNDPTKLADAGWAVIFPAKTDPAIKDALSELLTLREEQAGERFKIYAGSAGYRPGETKDKFFKRHKIGGGPADPQQMPYYVLLVGSPDEIPYEFQYQLDVMRGVGRIYFDALQGYANYAHSVVLAEKGKIRLPRKAGFFGVTSPGDKATELSSKYLVSPLLDKLKQQQPFVRWIDEGDTKRKQALDWKFESFMAEKATKEQLQKLLGGGSTPALLFTASHGMEFPLNDHRQIPHQGALLCQNWPGPNAWRGEIPQDFYFAGDDLGSANVSGLIAFFFACFGGGTPKFDQFAKQAQKSTREQIAPSNFVGALPQALLSQGGLAVVGHVERAWGYSFISPGAGGQTGVFEGALLQLLRGDPIGWVTENFNMKYADMATELTAILEELDYAPDYINPYDLAQKWTAHNDSRSYVVIGDPAVRIPFAAPGEKAKKRPPVNAVQHATSKSGKAVDKTPPVSAPPKSAPGADESFAVAFGLREQFSGLSDSLRKFTDQLARALGDAAADITTLEVSTYSTADLPAVAAGDENQAKLRAYTCVEFDGDMKVYVPEEKSGEVDQAVWKIHMEMVREAQANRAKFMQAMAEMATNLLKTLKL